MSLLVCIMVLSLQYMTCQKVISSREARASEQILADAQSSLDLSHALFERLGSLMHDVRHIVVGVRAEQTEGLGGYLDRVEKNLRSYDATLRTHSEAINAALAKMELLCGQQDITLACMAGRIDGGHSAAQTSMHWSRALDALRCLLPAATRIKKNGP